MLYEVITPTPLLIRQKCKMLVNNKNPEILMSIKKLYQYFKSFFNQFFNCHVLIVFKNFRNAFWRFLLLKSQSHECLHCIIPRITSYNVCYTKLLRYCNNYEQNRNKGNNPDKPCENIEKIHWLSFFMFYIFIVSLLLCRGPP